MSSNEYATPLLLEVQRSPLIAWILSGAHGGALLASVALPLPWWLRALAGIAIVASAVHSVRLHALLLDRRSVTATRWGTGTEWTLSRRDGTTIDATLLPGSYVHPLFAVLNFSVAPRRRVSVLLVPGRVDAERFRQLRIRMSMTGSSPA